MPHGDDRRRSSPTRRGGGQRDDRERGQRGGRGRSEERSRNEPAGIDRARRRKDAPPRAALTSPRRKEKVTEPPLAQDAPVDLPRGVRRAIERATDAKTGKRLLQHLTLALSALDQRDGRTALPHLKYLKARLPREGVLREALGVALYLEEDYEAALSELKAYQRLTGRPDQNHLIADATRAVGEGEHRIPELIEAMEAAEEPPEDAARYEGRIVWASHLADDGDIGAGRAVLAPLLEEDDPADGPLEHHLRLWYVAADLAERAGDTDVAEQLFARIDAVADEFFDTADRLGSLR